MLQHYASGQVSSMTSKSREDFPRGFFTVGDYQSLRTLFYFLVKLLYMLACHHMSKHYSELAVYDFSLFMIIF